MAADPRWLEVLKASGGQALALGGACTGLLAADYFKWIPPLEPWMIHAATFLGILGIMLWLVSVGSAFHQFYPIDGWARYYIRQHRATKDAEKYIPHMSAKEKEIVAYLLAVKRKELYGCRRRRPCGHFNIPWHRRASYDSGPASAFGRCAVQHSRQCVGGTRKEQRQVSGQDSRFQWTLSLEDVRVGLVHSN
jgi:hypothetical protein